MERADFIHLVRLSEHASAADSRAYRRSVAGFAALGYLWVVGCFLCHAWACQGIPLHADDQRGVFVVGQPEGAVAAP